MRIALYVGVVTGIAGFATCAEPPEIRTKQPPLTVRGERAEDPRIALADEDEGDDDQQLYYYNGDQKVYLTDTGHALAKLKADVEPENASVSQFTVRIEAADPLSDLAPALREQGFVLVRTRGPGALNLADAAAEPPDDVEYILPVVSEDSERLPEPRAGANAPMIMTPYISARFRRTMFAPDAGADARREAVQGFVQEFGLNVVDALAVPNCYRLTLTEPPITHDRLLAAANGLYEAGAGEGLLLYAKPDFIRSKERKNVVVNDPRFPDQWHLHNIGQGAGLEDADIDALEAWEVTEGDDGIRVAVIDDSVERDHEDLVDNFTAGRLYRGWTSPPSHIDDPSPLFDERHGTPCSGVAVARGNMLGGRGAAPNCGLIGVHFWYSTDSQMAEAFYFCDDPDDDPATDDGAGVISCSWSLTITPPADLLIAIDDLAVNGRGGLGSVILFAAGNDNGDIASNQNLARESVIVVGATSNSDHRAWYSNFGPELSVVAPSSHFSSALRIDTTDNTDPDGSVSGYAVGSYTGTGSTGFGGTSSATPLTAGVCGLILSVNPDLTSMEVRSILEHTADRIRGGTTHHAAYNETTGHDVNYGYGRVNAKKAVQVAQASLYDSDAIWPDHVQNLTLNTSSTEPQLSWTIPSDNVAGVLVVRSNGSAPVTGWRPIDGERYQVGDFVGNGGYLVINVDEADSLDLDPLTAATEFAVFAYNGDYKYSWGRRID